MTWGLYARVSTEEQAREGLSIDTQLDRLRAWAKARGVETREFVDAGKSAWTEDLRRRPGFLEALKAVRARELEGLAVTHMDRFSRKLIVTLQVLGEFGRNGISFLSLDNPSFDFSRPEDVVVMVVLGAFAEYYSSKLSRDIKRGLVKRASTGLHVGTMPFGYCNGKCAGCNAECERWGQIPKGSPPILHPTEAEGVRLAFESYRLGNFTDTTIANLLNDAGYRTRTRRGRELWNKHSVMWLLRNLTYTGLVVVKGKEYPGQQPPIISREVYEEAQAVRRVHSHQPRTYAPKHRLYLFNGIMYCSGCGRRMRAQSFGSQNQYSGYRCTALESGKVHCDKPQSLIRADLFESQFGELVKHLHLPQDWQGRVQRLMARDEKVENVQNRRRQLNQKLERLKYMFGEGDLTQADYLRQRNEVRGRLAALAAPGEREVMHAGEYLETLSQLWENATLAERKEVVGTLVTRVFADPAAKKLVAVEARPAFQLLFRQISQLREEDELFRFEGQATTL